MRKHKVKMSPPRFLVMSFMILIVLGTVLLELPISAKTPISWTDSMFVVVSCLTVTGLSTVDPGTTFTVFGQVVMMCLIQIGGLSIMSLAILVFTMLGRKISLQNRFLLQHSLNQTSVGGIVHLWRKLFVFAIGMELIAFILLSTQWVPEFGIKKGLYYSLFHAVSAFNNAGFSLFPNNLIDYVGNPLINFVISSLFIFGGIGFTVAIDVWENRSFSKLTLHSKLMIIGTIAINIVGAIIIFALEYSNPSTLASLSSGEKLLASYFQAVTLRTAGFNTIDLANITPSTALFMIFLMFIGAGSGSTGGGIKLTTFLVILFAVFHFLKGSNDTVIGQRSIKNQTIFKALAITTISVSIIFICIFILSITEQSSVLALAFEAVSAFGTVGLSMALTPNMTVIGKFVIMFLMFFGKVGPLTLAFSLGKRKLPTNIKYPKEDILTG